MVVGGAHQEVRRHTVRRSSLLIAGTALLSCVVLLAGLSVHYAALSTHTFDAMQVRAENERLQDRVAALKSDVAAVESRLEALSKHDQRLREMTHVAVAAPELAMGPLRQPAGASGGAADIDAFAVAPLGDFTDVTLLREEMVDGQIDVVSRALERQMGSLEGLIGYFGAREALLAGTPSVWPTKGWITSTFGFRSDPFTGAKVMHAGIDLAAPDGTQVLAPAAGTVIFAGDRGGYGNFIAIDHGRGLVTQYGHLSRVLVKVGEKVERGRHMGAVGNSGRSTGPHLHYEVRLNGVPVNPRIYVLEY
jgi:murein DD-endopeptidase MepM/ murein hydrolase activator NlpD